MLEAIIGGLGTAAALLCAMPALAQTPLDRADPSVIEDELRRPDKAAPDVKTPVQVERPEAAISDVGGPVLVGAILVEGAGELSPAAFAAVIDRHVGRQLAPRELKALAGEIADVARDAGFGLATAFIPEQRVSNGILRVVLDLGRIDEVRADGPGAAAVNRMLAPLADGRPVRTRRLERQLLLAGDIPGMRLGQARIERQGGRNVLRLRADRDRSQGRLAFDNWGSAAAGPVRTHLTGDVNGLLFEDDQLTLGGVITPLEPEDFGLIRAAYSKMLGRDGTRIGLQGYLARSRFSSEFVDIGGGGSEGAVSLSHPFIRKRSGSLRGEIEFGLRDAGQDFEGVQIREDRIATLAASASAFGRLADGYGHLRLALVQGLDVFGATEQGDPLASRPDGSAVFTKLELFGFYSQPLGRRFSMQAQVEGQLASRALLASEEMGLGGRYFLRGYDYREHSGDEGIAGSVEIRHELAKPPTPLKTAQIYVYGDAGVVGNRKDGLGGGSLASLGGGLRLGVGDVDASLEIGVPLEPGPQRGRKPRLSFTLATRF